MYAKKARESSPQADEQRRDERTPLAFPKSRSAHNHSNPLNSTPLHKAKAYHGKVRLTCAPPPSLKATYVYITRAHQTATLKHSVCPRSVVNIDTLSHRPLQTSPCVSFALALPPCLLKYSIHPRSQLISLYKRPINLPSPNEMNPTSP